MNHRSKKPVKPAVSMRKTLLLVAVGLVFLLAIGGYFFNWTWTGFSGNTLWDWLQLLVLPVALSSLTIWVSRGNRTWRSEWNAIAICVGVALLIVIIGGYGFNWTWTGFSGNTFWDWMRLLLLPLVLTLATIWFSIEEKEQAEKAPSKK